MKTVSFSQTSVNIYHSTGCYIPEDSYIQVPSSGFVQAFKGLRQASKQTPRILSALLSSHDLESSSDSKRGRLKDSFGSGTMKTPRGTNKASKGIFQQLYPVRFQVLTAASMMFRVVFWDILPCKMIVDRHFRGAYCL
jgi:hypothetical protein